MTHMEKIKITKDEEIALNTFRDHELPIDYFQNPDHLLDFSPLGRFDVTTLARLVFQPDSYEVIGHLESTIAEGDIVVRTTAMIGAENDYPEGFTFIAQKVSYGKVLDGLSFVHSLDVLRYPTREEYMSFRNPKLHNTDFKEGELVIRTCKGAGSHPQYLKGTFFFIHLIRTDREVVSDEFSMGHYTSEIRYPTAEEYIEFMKPKLHKGGDY